MKKTFMIAVVISVGLLTACTSNSPKVETNKQDTAKASDKAMDTAVNVAKGVAITTATKKVTDMASSKKKTKK